MYTYIHTRGRRKQEKRKDILFYSYQIRQITIDYSKVYMLTNAYYYYFDRKKNNQIQFYVIGQKLNIITTSFIYIFTISRIIFHRIYLFPTIRAKKHVSAPPGTPSNNCKPHFITFSSRIGLFIVDCCRAGITGSFSSCAH